MNLKPTCAMICRPSSRLWTVFLKISVALPLLVGNSLASSKLSKDLQRVPPGATVDVIVQFAASPNEGDFAGVARAGGALKQHFPNIHSALFTLPAAALEGIA